MTKRKHKAGSKSKPVARAPAPYVASKFDLLRKIERLREAAEFAVGTLRMVEGQASAPKMVWVRITETLGRLGDETNEGDR